MHKALSKRVEMKFSLATFVLLAVLNVACGKIEGVLRKLQQCQGWTQNATIVYSNYKVHSTANGVTKMSYRINVKKNVQEPIDGQLMIYKCADNGAPDTCQHFYTYKIKNACEIKHEIYKKLLDCITPKYVCPFKKGVYNARNCTLDFNLIQHFPLQSAFFRIETKYQHNSEPLSCYNAEVLLKKV